MGESCWQVIFFHQYATLADLISDMARSLLGLVVEGPEADLVWSTYQNEADDGCDLKMGIDEEDIQAQISDEM